MSAPAAAANAAQAAALTARLRQRQHEEDVLCVVEHRCDAHPKAPPSAAEEALLWIAVVGAAGMVCFVFGAAAVCWKDFWDR